MHGSAAPPPVIDLSMLMRAYALGMFPMADAREDSDVFWVEPESRAILPLRAFHLSHSLRKTLRTDRFEVSCNRDFAQVIALCAESASGREQTWINRTIEQTFLALHEAGRGHSIECWYDGRLVGGLYGLEIGRAFCGESMFSRMTDASKVALAWLVAAMRRGGMSLLDCQFMTSHLASLGAIEISQRDYLALLGDAIAESEFAPPAMRRPRIQPRGQAQAGVSAEGSGSLLAGGFAALVAGAEGAGAAAGPDAGGVSAAGLSPSSSPGKRIAHFLTHTS